MRSSCVTTATAWFGVSIHHRLERLERTALGVRHASPEGKVAAAGNRK